MMKLKNDRQEDEGESSQLRLINASPTCQLDLLSTEI